MEEYSIGEYIIYRNGEKYELGRIKSLREDGAFVAYHEGETGAKTPYDCMHKLINGYCIKETLLGGDYFRAEQTEPQKEVIACPIIDDDAWIYEEYRKGIDYAWSIAQKVFDSTVTFYEAEDVAKQIDKDINVRSKDERQTNADQHVQHVGSVEPMQTEREGE